MDLNRLTEKSQQALHDARAIALRHGNTEVSVEHLLLAMVDQRDGLAGRLLERLGVEAGALHNELERYLARLPKVSGPGATGQLSLSRPLAEVLDAAERTAHRLKDDYVSIEHLLLAVIRLDDMRAHQVLLGLGLTPDQVRAAVRRTWAEPDDGPARVLVG